jgi:hypothetical protein
MSKRAHTIMANVWTGALVLSGCAFVLSLGADLHSSRPIASAILSALSAFMIWAHWREL